MAAFVDTNVLIYAYVSSAANAPEKSRQAKKLLAELMLKETLTVSAQVLSEFSANAIKKGAPPLTIEQTSSIIAELSRFQVVLIDASLVQLALSRIQTSRISYWDALIVEAAIRSGATTLYTEDLHHGTRYGTLEVRNPFLA